MALTKAGNIVLKYPHRKNLIINGNFDIWQRGTSFANLTSGLYSADRWRRSASNDGVVTVLQGLHNGMLGSRFTRYCLGVQTTTADTSIGAAQYETQVYNIEGYDVQQIMGQTITLSFWVYTTVAGTYCISFRNSGVNRSYIAEYTINQANTPEYKTITFTMDNGSVGTWDYENGTGLSIFFILACGTSLQTTANSWQTINALATSNQVNFMSATSRSFFLYQVQLELGSSATPFENRPIGEELALCQRYYEKSYEYGTAVPTNSIVGSSRDTARTTYLLYGGGVTRYKVNKRISATPTIYSPQDSATGNVAEYDDGTTFVANRASTVSAYDSGFRLQLNNTGVANKLIMWQWAVDAEFN